MGCSKLLKSANGPSCGDDVVSGLISSWLYKAAEVFLRPKRIADHSDLFSVCFTRSSVNLDNHYRRETEGLSCFGSP